MRLSTSSHTKACGLILLIVLFFSPVSAISSGTYNVVHEIMDWGPATTKVIIELGVELGACPIAPETFSVHVRRVDGRADVSLLASGDRKVEKAYISDALGNRVDFGSFVALELSYGPEDELSSPMNYLGTYAWISCDYTVKQKEGIVSNNVTVSDFIATALGETYIPQIQGFSLDGRMRYADEKYGDVHLSYADYKPLGAFEGAGFPLIIWLHGGEEGGGDASLPITAYKACAFASAPAQAFFGGEAYVLAPQAETYWMDDGTRDLFEERKENSSKYTNALMRLIEIYIEQNPGIDRDRVYIGGASNGGFMTMAMILAFPEFFAAAFPVSEAALDALIPEESLLGIVDLPIWFVHSASDAVVPATLFTLSTYERLIRLGARNVQLSYPQKVIDTTGKFQNPDGSPYEYPGHWSWIYLHNNELTATFNGKQVTFLEWLAAQKRAE